MTPHLETLLNDTHQQKNNAYQLKHKTIGEIRGSFFVPRYQRGYRWDKTDVTRLLNDIWESKGNPYSLQPIVVKLHKAGATEAANEWELIDGQQRLTSLYLILHVMQEQGWKKMGVPYDLRYETRTGSQQYLKSLDKRAHADNIDFFHIYRAYHRIKAWFRKHGDAYIQEDVASTLHGYLFKSVRVIWYEAPSIIDATALFTRLNIGRIALTDAELIKAALLSAVRKHATDRAQEVAAQWDGIERDLQRDEIWAFLAGMASAEGNEKYPTRISLLLDTLANEKKAPPAGKRPRYYTFDTLRADIEGDFSAIWQKVVALHAKILGWFEQPHIYNKIGFLVACGDPFGGISELSHGKKKSEFEALLKQNIKKKLNVKVDDLNENLRYDDSKHGYPTLLKLLLLLNVETEIDHRFPFNKHVGEHWSLEHIHAQNAQDLTKAEQWKTWLEAHKQALNVIVVSANDSEIKKLIAEVVSAIEEVNSPRFGERFNDISSRVQKILRPEGEVDEPDHTLANMALLSSAHNSSLSNSVFEVKRQMILSLDRKGKYVPVCTRNVFLKYYAEANAQQPYFWGDADKKSYLAEIQTRLADYLVEASTP